MNAQTYKAPWLTCWSALQVSFRRRNSLRRRLFSLVSVASSPCVASLTTALFTICCARCANASVDWLSRRHAAAGLTLAMITVLALPPRESCNQGSAMFQGLQSKCFQKDIAILQHCSDYNGDRKP